MAIKIRIGKVKDFRIDTNKGEPQQKIMLSVELIAKDDIQTVELMTHAGQQVIPPIDSLVFVLDYGQCYKIAIAGSDGITPTIDIGEIMLYSQDGGLIKAFIKFLKDGILEINGNTDFAVAFDDLKTGFDALRTDMNTFITTIYNLHVHGPSPLPSVTGTQSTANIDASKINTIKVP
jgi:hypothetical protein